MGKAWSLCTGQALSQHGLITSGQAAAWGASQPALKRKVAAGELEKVLPGVYRLTVVPATPGQLVKAACLWGGAGTAASHTTAAALLGIKGFALDGYHVVTTKDPKRLPDWVNAHHVRHPPPGLWAVDGIPLTPPWVTLIDIGSQVAAEVVGRSLDEALYRSLVTLPQMRWALDTFGHTNHRGTTVMRILLLQRPPGYEPPQGELEARFFALVDASDLPPGVRQFRWWDGKKFRYFDLAYPDSKLGIELDGWETHGTREAFQDDRRRDRATQRLRWRVLRFTWDDVVRWPEEVVAEIGEALRQTER